MFGNAPRALWTRWAEPDAQNRIPLACRALLVQEPTRTVLLETGIGAFFPPKLRDRFGVVDEHHVLLRGLEAARAPHETIDVVILSHLHFDHAGGLLSAWEDGAELLFPNATFVVGEAAWKRACSPHARDRASFLPALNTKLEASGRLHIVSCPADDDVATSELLGEDWRFHVSNGHTPGLLATELSMPDGPIVFAADLIPGTPWVHAPITMGYDRFPERLIDEKESLLADMVDRGGRLFYTHDPETALSRVERDERGRFRAFDRLPALEGLTR
jgi:glyoxylase-like metal-dependent hydrolase (beta-lactamase superfamily II)